MNASPHPDLQPDEFVRSIRDAVNATGFQFQTVEFARVSQGPATGRAAANVWNVTIKATSAPAHKYDDDAMRATLANVGIELVRAYADKLTRDSRETTIVCRWRLQADTQHTATA